MDWDKNSLISEIKGARAEKKKNKTPKWWKNNHSAPPTKRPIPSHSPNNGCLGKTTPHFYCLARHHIGRSLILVISGQLAWLLPAYPLRVTEWETEKAVMVYKHFSAMVLIAHCLLVCYQNSCSHSTIQAAIKRMNSIPTRPHTTGHKEKPFHH